MAYIYKIEVGDCLYIGSTTDMKMRQRHHNFDIRNGCDSPIYKYCRENDIYKLELIELEYVDIEDRYIVEQYYIDEYKTGHKLLNGVNAIFDKKEYLKANKDKIKENKKAYYEDNKEKLNAYKKEYREANRDKLKNENKAYREANKDKIKAYHKAHYQAKKTLTHQPSPQAPSA